jgi:hypothetical protein
VSKIEEMCSLAETTLVAAVGWNDRRVPGGSIDEPGAGASRTDDVTHSPENDSLYRKPAKKQKRQCRKH